MSKELKPEELEKVIAESNSGLAEDGFGETPEELIEPEDFSEALEEDEE